MQTIGRACTFIMFYYRLITIIVSPYKIAMKSSPINLMTLWISALFKAPKTEGKTC